MKHWDILNWFGQYITYINSIVSFSKLPFQLTKKNFDDDQSQLLYHHRYSLCDFRLCYYYIVTNGYYNCVNWMIRGCYLYEWVMYFFFLCTVLHQIGKGPWLLYAVVHLFITLSATIESIALLFANEQTNNRYGNNISKSSYIDHYQYSHKIRLKKVI
jgi:hypothetical protein